MALEQTHLPDALMERVERLLDEQAAALHDVRHHLADARQHLARMRVQGRP